MRNWDPYVKGNILRLTDKPVLRWMIEKKYFVFEKENILLP